MTLQKDIENSDDITRLLRVFYKKILTDDSINYIFTDVAKIDIEEHIPVIAEFWSTVVFQSGVYQKNVMQIHTDLHKKSSLTPQHFSTWLNHFNESVDAYFSGPNAILIKQRAASIATLMQIKIRQS